MALFHGEGAHTQRLTPIGIISDPERTLLTEETRATTPTMVRTLFSMVRTLFSKENSISSEFLDDENFVEYYDINTDQWQFTN